MELEELRFCVKYPFTQEARSLLETVDISKLSDSFFDSTAGRIKQALTGKPFLPMDLDKEKSQERLLETLYCYPIAKIMVALPENYLIKRKFARSVSDDVYRLLTSERMDEFEKVVTQLFKVTHQGDSFQMSMYDYLKYPPSSPEYRLVNTEMKDGSVFLTKDAMAKVVSAYVYENVVQMKVDKTKIPNKMLINIGIEVGQGFQKEEKPLDLGIAEAKNFPPCMRLIAAGLQDGKKRSLFTLVNFLKSVNWPNEKISMFVNEVNKRNEPNLPQSMIENHMKYHGNKKAMKPANCDNVMYYDDIGICRPDGICANKKIRNPVNYVAKSMKDTGVAKVVVK